MIKPLHNIGRAICLAIPGFICFYGYGHKVDAHPGGTHSVHATGMTEHAVLPQERVITGTVSGESGERLPGASVVVKGTTVGTTTDFDGAFRLQVPSDAQVLVVSYIGYESKELNINNQTRIDVTLAPDLSTLQEGVVVGYGVQRKSDLTGAITSVRGAELTQ